MLTVGLLGPLVVSMDGRSVPVSAPTLRKLLVVLAMDAGSAVSLDRLASALWDGDLPESVHRTLHTHLTRLRAALGPGLLVKELAGYRLRVEPEQVDALRFLRLLDATVRAPDGITERAQLVAALALWRGDPFDGMSSMWLDGVRARLVERYLAAVERRADLEFAEGRHAELVAPLQELTASYPLREPLWVRFLTALDRCGRHAEALTAYESIRRRLADDLGADPGPELRGIHANLLAAPAVPERGQGFETASVEVVDTTATVKPRQLPADIAGFTGRSAALKALNGLLDNPDGLPGAVVISAIGGMAGVGKTALAVRWAHQVADRFPDGQLYVNLRGFHPLGQAMVPAAVVRGFLEALGVPALRIPADPEAQFGLYRSLLAGRRVLIVLDNARDSGQVRPLLPGSPTCVVLVTSRNRLTGLVAAEAARSLVLDPLSVDEARALLAARLGPEQIAADRHAANAVIARCAGLPLALAITAARAATSALPLAAIAAQIGDEQSALDVLDTGDPGTDMRVVFSWSYRTLSPAAARLFRLLGLPAGPDLAAAAAASLAGVTVAEVRRLLAELCEAELLTEHTTGRYLMHDLLRTYATELSHIHDGDNGRRIASHRLLDHYLHAATAAGAVISPHRHAVTIPAPHPGVTLERLADNEQALAWYGTEHRVLLAAVGHAAATGFDIHAWQLAWAISDYLYRSGYWDDWHTAYTTALAAARRVHDPRAEAQVRRGLAMACSNLGRHTEAHTHLRVALTRYAQLGDQIGQAHARLNLSALLSRQNRHTDALHHCRQALHLYTTAGDMRGQAMTLNTMGVLHGAIGDHQQALDHCRRAAALFERVGDRGGLASTWDSLGHIHHRLGRHHDAIRQYQRAATLFQELGHRFFQAETLANLGDSCLAAGNSDAARTAWRQAQAMFDETDHPQADRLRAKLETTPP